MAQQVKDPALSLQGPRLLLWCGFEPQPGELAHAAGSAKKRKGFYAEAAILGITRPVMPDKVEHLTSKQPPIDLPEARSWPSATAMPARLACPLWGHLYRVWWTEPGISPAGGSGCGPPPPKRAALRNSQGEKPLGHLVPRLYLRRGLMSPGNTAERAARRGKARELSIGAWWLGKGAERQRRTEPPGPWPERRCFTCSDFRRMRKVEA